MSTSDTYNTGIIHLTVVGRGVYCKQRRAHMALPLAEFRGTELKKCAKCAAAVAAFDNKNAAPGARV